MKGLVRRPLAVASALFLLLLFTSLRCGSAYALPLCVGAILAVLLILGAGFLFAKADSRSRRGLFLCAGLLSAAALAFFSAYRVDQFGLHRTVEPHDGRSGQAVLTINRMESNTSYSTSLLCTLHSFDQQAMEITGRVSLPYAADLRIGDRIALTAELTVLSPDSETLAECYDYSQGIFFEAIADENGYCLLSGDEPRSEGLLAELRTSLPRQFYPYLSDEDTGLVSALLTGDKSGLSDELSDQFRNLGISHTLAVSGLHLGILCGSLLWIFRKLRLARRFRLPVLLPILLFYMMMVGSPSVYRAGGMTLLLLAAYHFGRRQDPITSLLATVTLICLLAPESVLDVGLLLSFLATFGILLIAVPLTVRMRSLPRLPKAVLSALAVTGAATVFTLPFSVWYFGEWAILSPLANLLLVPIVTGLLYLAPLLLLLSPIAPLATAPALLIRLLSGILRAMGDFFGGSDHLLLPLGYPVIEGIALIAAFAVIALCFFRKTRPLTIAAAVVFLSATGGYCTYHACTLTGQREIEWLEEGENQCLTVTVGTRVMLIDHSSGSYTFLGGAVTASETDPLIRVDTLLLTHYRYRQISTVTHLLEAGRLEYLILPSPAEEDANTAYTLAERATRAGCSVQWYSKDESCIGYHDTELRFTFVEWDEWVPRTVTVMRGGIKQTFALNAKGAPSAE
ncbi:MAG: ComEC/Rec2 family competence protein [Clostridia bacterium]|nr:ComEC/Rec2 family competence protein [Clostridia bacterium]